MQVIFFLNQTDYGVAMSAYVSSLRHNFTEKGKTAVYIRTLRFFRGTKYNQSDVFQFFICGIEFFLYHIFYRADRIRPRSTLIVRFL